MRRNQLLGAATALGLMIAPFLATAWAGTQEKTIDKRAEMPRGAVVDSTKLAPKPYEEIFTDRGLSQKNSDMQAVLPQTTTGLALVRISTLFPYGLGEDNLPEVREMARDSALLQEAPDQALKDLQSGLQKLPAIYWAERQFLIQIGARLKAPRASVIQFLTAEMSRPVKISAKDPTNLAYMSPVVAADMLVAIDSNTAERDAAFRQAVKAQQADKDLSRLILSRYEVADATRAMNLARQLELLTK